MPVTAGQRDTEPPRALVALSGHTRIEWANRWRNVTEFHMRRLGWHTRPSRSYHTASDPIPRREARAKEPLERTLTRQGVLDGTGLSLYLPITATSGTTGTAAAGSRPVAIANPPLGMDSFGTIRVCDTPLAKTTIVRDCGVSIVIPAPAGLIVVDALGQDLKPLSAEIGAESNDPGPGGGVVLARGPRLTLLLGVERDIDLVAVVLLRRP